ncbi:unnamed protein product [Spirodela intermedia]|uniref:Uncharacterized protein n=1 Tax=Spirodela intermedia TaxID=51605 RepID=A0A7I8LEG3_SPIIN|nr:unnamed protein product [Spirodela intermedia]
MSGLFAYSIGGLGLLLVGAVESLSSSFPAAEGPLTPSFRFLCIGALASLALLNSLISAVDSLRQAPPPPRGRDDELGVALQLGSAAVTTLFLLYALAGAASSRKGLLRFPRLPSELLDLVGFFAFAAEFLLFHLQLKDANGVENRYYDLLLVPVAVCAAATLLCASLPRSPFPRLARGLGLVLHGTWFLQMGFSFFSSAVAHGCSLRSRSRGDYTVQCRGHAEYHRARAVATLQFNGHLALLVLVSLGVYAAVVATGGAGPDDRPAGDRYRKYKPLSEMQRLDDRHHHHPAASSRFTLDSDEEEEGGAAAEISPVTQAPPPP